MGRTLGRASTKMKREQSSLSNTVGAVRSSDRFNTRRHASSTSRRGSKHIDSNADSMMEVISRPEHIYSSLRNSAVKKKVLVGIDRKSEEEDDEAVYQKQKNKLELILKGTERGLTEASFDMEGILYYRFHYDE